MCARTNRNFVGINAMNKSQQPEEFLFDRWRLFGGDDHLRGSIPRGGYIHCKRHKLIRRAISKPYHSPVPRLYRRLMVKGRMMCAFSKILLNHHLFPHHMHHDGMFPKCLQRYAIRLELYHTSTAGYNFIGWMVFKNGMENLGFSHAEGIPAGLGDISRNSLCSRRSKTASVPMCTHPKAVAAIVARVVFPTVIVCRRVSEPKRISKSKRDEPPRMPMRTMLADRV